MSEADLFLLEGAAPLVTMDPDRRVLRDGWVAARDGLIVAVGEGPAPATIAGAPRDRFRRLDAAGRVVLPGLVNTHHHLYQTLTRCIAQDEGLFNWLRTLYPIWARMNAEAVYVSAKVGLAELLLSGCTTSSDHLYLYPNGSRIDDEIRAAQELGVRFHAARGSLSLGQSQGGLPPDSVVEDEAAILRDCQRAVETFHQAERFGMVRVALAPCSPFSVTPDLMRESAVMARHYGVRLHTHLAETLDEEQFCLETFGHRPVEYVESLGWTGDDVWHAHCVHMRESEIAIFARTGTGVAHCPNSNMRLASGIAPIRALRQAKVSVGLGVDGSASNDSSHLLAEARQAMLLQRVLGDPDALGAQGALELATLGGARVLGRDDIGALAPGLAADFIGYRLERLEFTGALHDPLAALVFCTPVNVDLAVVNGRMRVREGHIVDLELPPLVARHNAISRAMIRDEPLPG